MRGQHCILTATAFTRSCGKVSSGMKNCDDCKTLLEEIKIYRNFLESLGVDPDFLVCNKEDKSTEIIEGLINLRKKQISDKENRVCDLVNNITNTAQSK